MKRRKCAGHAAGHVEVGEPGDLIRLEIADRPWLLVRRQCRTVGNTVSGSLPGTAGLNTGL